MSESGGPSKLDLADIVEHLSEGLQVVGPGFVYLYVNPVAAAHGQRQPGELVGRTMMEMYPGIEQTEMFGHVRRILEEGGSHRMQNEFTFPDGSTGWFELRMARIPQGVLILSIDVTENKRLEMHLRRAQRMDAVGRLAGGIAHDFNNLLTVIQNFATFIREDLREEDPMREDVDCILDAARRGGDLTRKLLAFASQLPVSPRSIDVARALGKLGRLLARVLGDDVVLRIESAEDVGNVHMDPSAFDQVLMNLAINARDAMPDGGTLTIEADRVELAEGWAVARGVTLQPGPYVVVSVSDSGTGIAPADLERVFELFFTTKAADKGTGLGLATSWGVVEQAGGTISVYSEQGAGTTFRVYLPRVHPEAVAQRPPPSVRPRRSAGERVLLVEDEDPVRALLARILRSEGYKVIEASSAGEALLLAEDVGDRLDLLLTDLVMPRMSGAELAERLRRRFPNMRVLLVSGFAPRSLAHRGMNGGDLPMLSKPFTPDTVLDAVRAALDAPGDQKSDSTR